MIINPNGAPARKKQVPMSRVDVKMVTEFEQWCRANKLSLDLYCDACAKNLGPRGARMWANNARDATAYHLECHCTDRVYGAAGVAAERSAPVVTPKIQILVP